MDKSFQNITETFELSEDIAQQLHNAGFVIIEGAIADNQRALLSEAYDAAVSMADPSDVSISSSIRVHDFVNRGQEFDELYTYGPLLAACCRTIGRPFKLSTMLARTVKPGVPAQALHVDFKRDDDGWPMIGFIIMIDEFCNDNGATRFVPGSHFFHDAPADVMNNATADYNGQAMACGPAGSMIIYNGSIWHGFTANRTASPRRSIQGAFIRREAPSGINQRARVRSETLDRIGDLAKYLLDLDVGQQFSRI